LVALTGQPLAVEDASSDPRHASEIAQRIGYQPKSLLCVPLAYDETVIGVLEMLDKEGNTGFDPDDINALTLFAAQAAIAIEQSRAQRNLAALLKELLASLGDARAPLSADLLERVGNLASLLELEPAFRRAVDMAALVHQLAVSGEAESDLCLKILRAAHQYAGVLRGQSSA
jgi:GAF domain-containing protein